MSSLGIYRGGMRFRQPEWDVAMPEALVAYWTAWNTRDLDQIRGLLDRAVIPEVEWNDPRDSFVGIDELERAMRRLRSSRPNYEFSIASESTATTTGFGIDGT